MKMDELHGSLFVASALLLFTGVGMILADNGSDMYLSGAPNDAWDDQDLDHLKHMRAESQTTLAPV